MRAVPRLAPERDTVKITVRQNSCRRMHSQNRHRIGNRLPIVKIICLYYRNRLNIDLDMSLCLKHREQGAVHEIGNGALEQWPKEGEKEAAI